MVKLSEEWRDKAQAKLANASTGAFFQTTEARLIPNFDRGDDADDGKSSVKFCTLCNQPSADG